MTSRRSAPRAATTSDLAGRLVHRSGVLPSGVPAAELGLVFAGQRARVPLGLVAPDGEEAAQLLAAAPERASPPDWWRGPVVLARPHLVVSFGAVSFAGQVIPLLEAAERARARCVAVLAPMVTHEALATLLVNDLRRVLPGGIVPLQLLVPEFHVEEALAAIAAFAGTRPWPGGAAPVQPVRLERLVAATDQAELWLPAPTLARRLAGWWPA